MLNLKELKEKVSLIKVLGHHEQLEQHQRNGDINFIPIKPFTKTLWPVDGGWVTMEDTTPIKTEMFHHKIKANS